MSTPVKMYKPIPTSIASPSQGSQGNSAKDKILLVEQCSESATVELDTLLKSALYSISKSNSREATQELERVRRVMKAHHQKVKYLMQEIKKDITSDQQAISCLTWENNSLKNKIEENEKSIHVLFGDDGGSGFDDDDKEENKSPQDTS